MPRFKNLPFSKILVEIFSVVFAVLLALWVNEWRSVLEHRDLAGTALEHLLAEARAPSVLNTSLASDGKDAMRSATVPAAPVLSLPAITDLTVQPKPTITTSHRIRQTRKNQSGTGRDMGNLLLPAVTLLCGEAFNNPWPELAARRGRPYIHPVRVRPDYGHKRARNKRIGPGGGTRRLHQHPVLAGHGAETGSTNV